MVRNNIQKTEQPRKVAIQPKEANKLGRVYTEQALLKNPATGLTLDWIEVACTAGTGYVFFDNTGLYQLSSGNALVGFNFESVNSFEFGTSGQIYLNRLGVISTFVIEEMRIAVANPSNTFTGTVEIIQMNAFGKVGSEFLDMQKGANPKTEFSWLYQFKDVNWLVNNFFAIFVNAIEDCRVSFKIKLVENSHLMRIC